MNKQFEGFDYPNTTPVPDIVFDELLEELTGNELKALLYIIRRTYGFGKNADAISLSQFRGGIKTREKELDRGCGIKHNRTILAALTSLEKKGYVLSTKRQTNAGDSDTTIYRLRFKKSCKEASEAPSPKEVVTPRHHVVTSSNDGSYSTSPRWLPEVTTVVTSGNQQETVLQETVLQEDTFGANAPARASFDHSCSENCEICAASTSAQKGREDDDFSLDGNPVAPPLPGRSPDRLPLAELSDTQRALRLVATSEKTPTATEVDEDVTPLSSEPEPGPAPKPKPKQQTISASPSAGGAARNPGSARDQDEPRAPDESAATGKGKGRGRRAAERVPEIPPEAVRIMDDWDSLNKKPVPRTQTTIDAAILLVPFNPSKDELDAVRLWLFTTDRTDKPWYRRIGVHLPDIAKNIEKWQSLQELEERRAAIQRGIVRPREAPQPRPVLPVLAPVRTAGRR